MPSHDRLLQSRFTRRQALLTLVAYSTPREAYEEIISLFQETPEGANVVFETSFAASGEQSRAVESGLPADVVALSLEPDITRLVEPGLVAEDWNAGEYKGMVTDSVVVLAVRPDNPKGIATWDDLLREGVEVITPNPLTSGGAKWNLMAAYGAQLAQGKSEEEALQYLHDLLANTPVQDKSAREALQTFAAGKGDVMLAYENEAITAQQEDIDLDYVIPDQTILIQNPIAVTAESEHQEQARAFVSWLRTDEAQRIFADHGYRSVKKQLVDEKTFPTPKELFTIDKLGGWDAVNTKFFDPDAGAVAKIEQDLGVSTD